MGPEEEVGPERWGKPEEEARPRQEVDSCLGWNQRGTKWLLLCDCAERMSASCRDPREPPDVTGWGGTAVSQKVGEEQLSGLGGGSDVRGRHLALGPTLRVLSAQGTPLVLGPRTVMTLLPD